MQVNIHDAKTQLSKLIECACLGEEVVIAKAGKPVVRLIAVEPRQRGRRFGVLRGRARVDDRFFEPLPEIATKVRIGKLPGAVEVVERFSKIIGEQDFDSLPKSAEHARQAGLMPSEHRDPFDRMLIAQSQIEGLTIVSNEVLFDGFGIRRLW